jgi:hypothetical protein
MITSTPSDRESTLLVLVRGAVMGIAVAVALQLSSDPDLWGHLRSGEDFLSTFTVPSSDVYSFTSDRTWINHEWLTDVVLASAYRLGGTVALAILAGVLVLAALVVARWSARRAGVGGWRLEALTAAVFALGVAPLAQTLRAQAISAPLFVLLLALMRELDRERYRVAFALPLLFLVWANLHGAWVMAGGVLAIWTFVRAAQTPSPRVRLVLLGAGVLSAAATLVNPYGAELWRFLFETVRFARGDIVEWRSLRSTPIMFLPWLATVAIALLALARARREQLAYFAVCLFLGVSSFQVIRLVPFFSLSVLLLLGPLLAGSPANVRTRLDARGWAGASIIWTICVASSTIGQARVGCLQTRGAFFVDEQAASFLRENQATGRLVVWFDWGEYVSWHFGPALKVSMDGRRETVYSAALLQAHNEFYRNESGAREFLERLSPDYIWLPKTLPVSPMITGWGWTTIFETGRSTVWARGKLRTTWRTPAPPTSSCFPAA